MFVQKQSSVQRLGRTKKAAAILSLNSNDDVQPEEIEVAEDDTEDNE